MSFDSIFKYFKKNYAVVLSALVAVVCAGVHFVRGEQITRLAADSDDLSIRHSRILKNLKFASDIDIDLDELEKLNIEVFSRLFQPEDLATNQRYFYQIESTSGIQMTRIHQLTKALPSGKANKKARKKAERSSFQPLVYDMNIVGEYREVLAFMREVEGGDAFAALDGFSVVPAKGVDGESLLNMRISFDVMGSKS